MIRSRENRYALQSGVLALLVHGVFLVLLLVSFSWKNVQPPQAMQVELWESLPQPQPLPPPVVTPPPPPEATPAPPPEPTPQPKAEIALKPKPPAPEVKKPPRQEPSKPDPAILKKQEEEKRRKEKEEKLKELQKLMASELPPDEAPPKQVAEKQNPAETKRASDLLNSAGAPNSDEINKYKGQIVAKIKRFVNKQLCGSGKPEIAFSIALMPTGEVNGAPRLARSSGMPACDQAVERAIMQAQPLPLPPQPELFNEFRNLNLRFRPND